MAVKEVTGIRLSFLFGEYPPQALIDAAQVCLQKVPVITSRVTHVCEHCDEPWPTLGQIEQYPASKPMSEDNYQFAVNHGGFGITYCCDAARLECESA